MSRIGKLPITVPSGVDVKIEQNLVTVKGPKGTLSHTVAAPIVVDRAAGVMTTTLDRVTGTTSGTTTDTTTVTTARQLGPELPLHLGSAMDWEVFADPQLGRLEVFLDGRFAAYTDIEPVLHDVSVAEPAGADVQVTIRPTTTPVCDRLAS